MTTLRDASLPDALGGPPLRIAVFGWIQENGGSVASAHYQLCRALLDAGHGVDLFAHSAIVPDPGFASDGYNYIPIEVRLERELRPSFPKQLRPLVGRVGGRRRTASYVDQGTEKAKERHAKCPYDAMLFLGTTPRTSIPGIPMIVWAQSAPQNELRAARNLARPIMRVSGAWAYVKLRMYYEVKDRLVWRWARRRYHLILASSRARAEAVDFGVPYDRICVSPYAIDLERFSPNSVPDGPLRKVLCVGRLDPRKRVDLLVDAVAELAQRRQDFEVEVIGRDGYIPGWSRFVEREARDLPLRYTPPLPQPEIVERLRQADVMVQPSEHEEFGHAIAEALACGVPVVTGPTNGTSQWVPAQGSATFDRYDPASLADALDRALDLSRDPQARQSCRDAAQEFGADRVAARIVGHIRSARG